MDLKALEVYQSRDYDKFVIDSEYNREVSVKHVKKIQDCYKQVGDFGKLFPIIVDDKFRIIDGQHRFMARKSLNMIVYYVQSIEITPDQLGLINDAISKWKSDDFQKVAVKTNIFKYAKAFKESLGANTKVTVANFLRAFKVTKNDLITDSNDKLDKIKKETLNLRQYVIWLEQNLNENIITGTASSIKKGVFDIRNIITLAKKLSKLGVRLDELPINARYYELIEYLQKQGYKIK